jgi:hypothetical protein
MKSKSRACYCASGLAIVFGIILAASGVAILVAIALEQPDSNLWLILVLVIGAGLGVVLVGLVCCGCSMMCYSTNNSVGTVNDEEQLTKNAFNNEVEAEDEE